MARLHGPRERRDSRVPVARATVKAAADAAEAAAAAAAGTKTGTAMGIDLVIK